MSDVDARSLSQEAQEALRVRGVKLVVEEGWSQVAVAQAFGVDARVVRRWLTRFRRGGWAALAKQRRGRRAGEQQALSAAQQQRVVGLIVGHCPDQLQIPGLLWTRAAVQALIEREAGVRLEISTVGRYLRAWGFTLKKPSKRALEQDPVVVQAWLEDVYPASPTPPPDDRTHYLLAVIWSSYRESTAPDAIAPAKPLTAWQRPRRFQASAAASAMPE